MLTNVPRVLASALCAFGLGAACVACGDDDIDATDTTDPTDTTDTTDGDDGPAPDAAPDPARRFLLRVENVAPWSLLKLSSARTRTDRIEGNLAPGQVYETRFSAAPGHRLTFAFMMFESNDWFFAPDPAGIPLFTNGVPLSGDITNLVQLWDAGSELDQEPGVGAATGARQATRDVGDPDPDPAIRLVPETVTLGSGAPFTRPPVAAMVRVTLLPPNSDGVFTLRFENVSTVRTLTTSAGTRAVTLTPVVWAIHRGADAFFTAGMPRRANGLEFLAEAGQPDPLVDGLRFSRGVATPLSRGVWAVHRSDGALFTLGAPDAGRGLEGLAEDGDPTALHTTLGADASVRAGFLELPAGSESPGPAMAGDAFEATFDAEPGDRLSFATMFGASNDWFFAPGANGIELFLGTESDQELDVGASTAAHQAAPNTGSMDGTAMVREVPLPIYQTPVQQHVRVQLMPVAE